MKQKEIETLPFVSVWLVDKTATWPCVTSCSMTLTIRALLYVVEVVNWEAEIFKLEGKRSVWLVVEFFNTKVVLIDFNRGTYSFYKVIQNYFVIKLD